MNVQAQQLMMCVLWSLTEDTETVPVAKKKKTRSLHSILSTFGFLVCCPTETLHHCTRQLLKNNNYVKISFLNYLLPPLPTDLH